jgi:hypothetical protein
MSHEIRHFLVFVEQDQSLGRPVPDELVPLPLSSALEDHFGARRVQAVDSNAVLGDSGQTPLGRPADPGRQ